MKILFALLALVLCTNAGARDKPHDIDEALKQAAVEHLPVFVDFQATWCYSCYYMATNVLTGPQWNAIEKRSVVVEVDADSPDGARWMKKLGVIALPTYVVLNADGSELGRVLAEQPRAKFYPAMQRILGGKDSLDVLKAKAAHGGGDAIAQVLASYYARGEGDAALAWYAGLAASQRKVADSDHDVAPWLARLRMGHAQKAQDMPQCVAQAQQALAGELGCDRYYVLETMLDCSEKSPAAERKTLLVSQKSRLDQLLAEQVFVPAPTCADQRTAVLVAADLDKAIGDGAAETAVLDRGIAAARERLGNDLGKDRNAADNLRVYLARADRTAELDELLPRLMQAYPDDYVYAFRHARNLIEKGNNADALPFLERAAAKAFGANRLAVATLRVKTLLLLQRRDDAEKVAADALEANGPWFPEQAAKLKAALKT